MVVFTNVESVDRIIYAIFSRFNEDWKNHTLELTEQQIGSTLFHKPSGYSSLEDSSVRVHARQLRLKLHEYFDEEGRNEPLILSVPKGSYTPIFKPATKAATPIAESALGV